MYKSLIIVGCFILISIIMMIVYMNCLEILLLKDKTTNYLSTVENTINDIDEHNRKLEFENKKYIYHLYDKHNDFSLYSNKKNKFVEIDTGMEKSEQKYNMMKKYDDLVMK